MIDRLKELLDFSKHCLVFTGAGISTLSGIPDFRSANGVFGSKWRGMNVQEVLSLSCFKKHPELFYAWSKSFVYNLEQYQPNVVHRVVAKLERLEIVSTVYTQNIDMLHQRAGSVNVIEIHGSPSSHHCLTCQAESDYNTVARTIQADLVPKCNKCGGIIKPDIVFYGQDMDMDLLDNAFLDMWKADLLLVLGSSLAVQPAANLPLNTYYSGGKIVIVNKQPTPLDQYATLKFDDLNEVFTELENWLK
jgi:NAD-dependent deacetylase